MIVTGFTFIKDAIIYDYPIVEAIKSILPICDQVVVAVGYSSDDTLKLISEINKDKIIIVKTKWDESLREGGRVLAVETDKAFAAIPENTDWCFYIQGDEVVHEKYLDTIYDNMLQLKDHKNIDGLLFNYLHFYASYDYVGSSSNWYNREIRVIRNDKSIFSYKDAQGFRKENSKKLRVYPIDAYIYHYGWVKEPKSMQKKQENFNKYWHDDNWVDKKIIKSEEFDYESHVKELKPFLGDHPRVMQARINAKSWVFDYEVSKNKKNLKDKFKEFVKKTLGIDIAYKNYIIAKI